ncbi:AAA family ATPase [Occultella gossypii]|uniref:AAA domain-containing protein n=1 Tax=Occultella gossypii TaxID=2800820 RepID=A0ABS7S473_9MICO|nr:AAA family ATPase [Occultella gossypii]MBZ2195097.1 hypothetical protein [Occultella gossypii]
MNAVNRELRVPEPAHFPCTRGLLCLDEAVPLRRSARDLMLLSLTGASGAGKSTTLAHLTATDWEQPVTCVEFDSVGVPPDADTAWRHAVIEQWVQRALAAQDEGSHVLLCGQVPVGELLAAPSADRLDGIAACVLHCSPEVRRARLMERGEPEDSLEHHVAFGEWSHGHAVDPTFHPEVIRVESSVPMRWERWDEWRSGDPRWPAHVVDTDGSTPEQVAQQVVAWARDVIALGALRLPTER